MKHFRFFLIFILALQAKNTVGMNHILNSLGFGKTQFDEKALAIRRLFGEEEFETKISQQNIQKTEKKDKSYVGGRWDLNICNIDSESKKLERELNGEISQKRLHYYFDKETEKESEEDDWEVVEGPGKLEIIENYMLGSIILISDNIKKKNLNIIENYMDQLNTEKQKVKTSNHLTKPKINSAMLNTIIGYENKQKNLAETKTNPLLVTIKQEKVDEQFSTQDYELETNTSEDKIVFEVPKNSPQAKLIPLLMLLIQNNKKLLGKDCFVYEPPKDFETFPDKVPPSSLNELVETQYFVPETNLEIETQHIIPKNIKFNMPCKIKENEKENSTNLCETQKTSKPTTKKRRKRRGKKRKKYTIHITGFNPGMMRNQTNY